MAEHDDPQQLDAPPPHAGRRLHLALLSALLLAAALGGFAWYTQDRVANLEQALAEVRGERDAALAAAGEAQRALDEAQSALTRSRDEQASLDTRRLELETELAQSRAEVARLQAPAPVPSAAAVPEAPEAAAPATITELQELAEGAGPAAGAAPVPALTRPREPTPLVATPLVTAAEPAPEPAAPTAAAPASETLTITFDVNSSYFPASLNGRLRQLAGRLQPGQAYAVRLTGSVGTDPVANGGEGDAASYNRWIAERRMTRVADFLQDNSDTLSLAIEQTFAANDASRRVVVDVRPVQP